MILTNSKIRKMNKYKTKQLKIIIKNKRIRKMNKYKDKQLRIMQINKKVSILTKDGLIVSMKSKTL